MRRRLENYSVPRRLVGKHGRFGAIPGRLGKVFRDRDDLSSSGDLNSSIIAALAESEALIVVCSPPAAQSRWVNAEVRAFKVSGRGDRILCYIADGDPKSVDSAVQCFPPALFESAQDGAAPREPLAADARRVGDGRKRAFLKLVAGLLGLGYDELARREAQRHTARLAMGIAASLTVTALSLVLATTAYMARNDARRRQAQAEDIVGFMLGDLRKKLETVGRLDLLRAVDDKAIAYFAKLDTRDLSDKVLEEQARSLKAIGEVRVKEGKHDAALAAFREAHARTSLLQRRQPDNGQRLYDLAQTEYWIGFVAYEQQRNDEAGVWFQKYHDSAARLALMNSGNFEWQMERFYGLKCLVALEERRGQYDRAEDLAREELALVLPWVDRRPDDMRLRVSVADTFGWLGTLALNKGRLEEAERRHQQQVDFLHEVASLHPKDARWHTYLFNSRDLLGEVQLMRGRLAEAATNIAAAAEVAERALERDPSNNTWRANLGRSHTQHALLLANTEPARSRSILTEADSLLALAHERESKSSLILGRLARARVIGVQLAVQRITTSQDESVAREMIRQARALIEPALNTESSSKYLRVGLAELYIAEGELSAREGDTTMSLVAFERARALLERNAGIPVSFESLDPLVRALRYAERMREAEAYENRLKQASYVPLRPFPR